MNESVVTTSLSFTPHSLLDLNDKSIQLDQNKFDALTVVHFWATWCAPCLEELSSLSSFIKESKGITFYLVAVNDRKESILAFLDKLGIPDEQYKLVVLDADSSLMLSLGTVRLPETYFFKDRKFLRKLEGSQDWTTAGMKNFIQNLH